MAKKKSKSSNLGLILKVVVLALGVAAFCMAFLKVATYAADLLVTEVETSYTGFQAMFGYSKTAEVFGKEVTTEILKFSFMALLTFVLPLVGAGLSFVNNKIVKFVGAGLMIAGGVLMFFVPSFVIFASEASVELSLGIGAILGGVFSLLGGLVAGYAVLTNK